MAARHCRAAARRTRPSRRTARTPPATARSSTSGLQNEREWARFCAEVLDQPALASDPRFSANADRVAHRDELDALITAAFATHSAEEVLARLDAAQIANARMNTVAGVSRAPAARGSRPLADGGVTRPVRSARCVPPFGMSDVRAEDGPDPGRRRAHRRDPRTSSATTPQRDRDDARATRRLERRDS